MAAKVGLEEDALAGSGESRMERFKAHVVRNKRRYWVAATVGVVWVVLVVVVAGEVKAFLDTALKDSAEGLIDGASNGGFGNDRDTLKPNRTATWVNTTLTFADRAAELLDICQNVDDNTYCSVAKVEVGGQTLPANHFNLERWPARKDGVDFDFPGFARVMQSQNPNYGAANLAEIRTEVLNMLWWMDQPNDFGDPKYDSYGGDQQMWSENHNVLYNMGEFLFGDALPTETFNNAGLTGEQHRALAADRLRYWMDKRVKFGFTEFLSDTYNDFVLAALVTLADIGPTTGEFADITQRAAMLCDLLLFEIATHARDGVIASARGRPTGGGKFDFQSLSCTIWLLSGVGFCRDSPPKGAVSLALATNYAPPTAILQIAEEMRSLSAPVVSRQRHGLDPADATAERVTTTTAGDLTAEDAIYWFNLEGYLSYPSSSGFFVTGDAYDFYRHPVWKPLASYRDLAFLVPLLTSMTPSLSSGSLLGPANVYTYITPHVALGSAIDYNAGGMAANQLAFEASLAHDVKVHINMPGISGFWRGSASLPRVAQHERVLIAIFNAPEETLEFVRPSTTHAFFPRVNMDEVVEPTPSNPWLFGRVGDGYIAVTSQNQFVTTQTGLYANLELVAPGTSNVWMIVVGDVDSDSDFATFQTFVQSSLQTISVSETVFDDVTFGWDAPLKVAGETQITNHFARYESPFLNAKWGDDCFLIQAPSGGDTLLLDFSVDERVENDPTALTKCPQVSDPAELRAQFVPNAKSQDAYEVDFITRTWWIFVVIGLVTFVPPIIFGVLYGLTRLSMFGVRKTRARMDKNQGGFELGLVAFVRRGVVAGC
ncbi:Uncharacterized protein SCF082_LOCUS1024 [Durusdinium trenchii]|uniref:Uncharacterized protein n=1 Tax=Durusdinium trenchii TaxID=1381693 RepID=A0ABP0HCN7_9DINO